MSCAEFKLHWSFHSVFLLSWKLAQRGLQRNRRRRRILFTRRKLRLNFDLYLRRRRTKHFRR